MLTTLMLKRWRFATAKSSAAITLLVNPLPFLPSTLRPTKVTDGATPM